MGPIRARTSRRVVAALGAVTLGATALAGTVPARRAAAAGAAGVAFVADNPPRAVLPAAGQPISDFVFTESTPGTIAAGTTVCVAIVAPASGVQFSALGPDAQVQTTGGGAQASAPTLQSPQALTFTITSASAGAPATFTVTGLSVDESTATLGQVRVQAGVWAAGTSSCGTDYGPLTVATAVVDRKRLAAGDRYATAAAVFDDGYGCSSTSGSPPTTSPPTTSPPTTSPPTTSPGGPPAPAKAAVLARGDTFPDALAGSYLAGALRTGILLTDPATLPQPVLDSLRRDGVGTVYLLGGTVAIGTGVEAQLAATPAWACDPSTGAAQPALDASGNPATIRVVRVAGATRYDTAAAVATRAETSPVGTLSPASAPGSTPVPAAVVVTGANFPDALAAGPIGYAGTANPANGNGRGLPIVLTDPASLPAAAQDALGRLGVRLAVVVGGPVAVSNHVEDQLRALGISTFRLAGVDRADTAVWLQAYEAGRTPAPGGPGPVGLSWPHATAVLVRGDQFADALAGGPHAGGARAPLLLASSPGNLGVVTYGGLRDAANTTGTATLDVLGGTSAIAPATADSAANALTGATVTVGASGYDISWPDCGHAYPPTPPFGIVGVNDGVPYSQNPCLASEYAWAAAAPALPQLYLNLSNPAGGPSWNQGGPRACTGTPDDLGCAYDFGWQAAVSSVAFAESQTGATPRRYWLDIETTNRWSANLPSNATVIRGALDGLQGLPGVASVGIYSTGYQWRVITGAPPGFAGYPNWVPGASGPDQAPLYCTRSATGGPVVMVQFPLDGFDGDAPCR